MSRHELRHAPSPIPPLAVSVVLVIPVATFMLALVLNLQSGDPVTWRGPGLLGFSVILFVIAFATFVARIPPWRRYLAATTPEQRASDKAADRADKATARVARSSTTIDYGTRIDAEKGRGDTTP